MGYSKCTGRPEHVLGSKLFGLCFFVFPYQNPLNITCVRHMNSDNCHWIFVISVSYEPKKVTWLSKAASHDRALHAVWTASSFHLIFHLASVQSKDIKEVAHQVEAVQSLQSEVLQNLDIGVEMLHGLNENAVSLDLQMKSSLQLQVCLFYKFTARSVYLK